MGGRKAAKRVQQVSASPLCCAHMSCSRAALWASARARALDSWLSLGTVLPLRASGAIGLQQCAMGRMLHTSRRLWPATAYWLMHAAAQLLDLTRPACFACLACCNTLTQGTPISFICPLAALACLGATEARKPHDLSVQPAAKGSATVTRSCALTPSLLWIPFPSLPWHHFCTCMHATPTILPLPSCPYNPLPC